jgi:hypothetical protein
MNETHSSFPIHAVEGQHCERAKLLNCAYFLNLSNNTFSFRSWKDILWGVRIFKLRYCKCSSWLGLYSFLIYCLALRADQMHSKENLQWLWCECVWALCIMTCCCALQLHPVTGHYWQHGNCTAVTAPARPETCCDFTIPSWWILRTVRVEARG